MRIIELANKVFELWIVKIRIFNNKKKIKYFVQQIKFLLV